MESVRIALVDDHTVVRNGLRVLLERQPGFVVVAEAADGRGAIDAVEREQPDIVVLDVAMPNLNGIEAARQISAKNPAVGIVVLSMHSDESYVLRALKAGAKGYLLKDSAEADLISAIRAVHAGKSFFSPAISKVMQEEHVRDMQQRGVTDTYELLTTREREILQLLAENRSNKDVANILNVSLYTVETHRGNILQKLNLHGIADLVLYAVRKGIIA